MSLASFLDVCGHPQNLRLPIPANEVRSLTIGHALSALEFWAPPPTSKGGVGVKRAS